MAIRTKLPEEVFDAAQRWEFLDPTDPDVQQMLARWLALSVDVETGRYSRNYVEYVSLTADFPRLMGFVKRLPCMKGVPLRAERNQKLAFLAAYVWVERLLQFCASLRRPGDTALVPMRLHDYRTLSRSAHEEAQKVSDYRWKLHHAEGAIADMKREARRAARAKAMRGIDALADACDLVTLALNRYASERVAS